jgi:hypothetical protein
MLAFCALLKLFACANAGNFFFRHVVEHRLKHGASIAMPREIVLAFISLFVLSLQANGVPLAVHAGITTNIHAHHVGARALAVIHWVSGSSRDRSVAVQRRG